MKTLLRRMLVVAALVAATAAARGEELTPAEVKRQALNDASDKLHLRQQSKFVVEHTDAFLKVPEKYAADTSFDRAKVAPTIRLQILPDLKPEYFSSTNQYMACWANWGHVARSDDNHFFMAASDHLARGCDLNIYEYTPGAAGIKKRIDVDQLLGWRKDGYTDGKLHGHMGIISNRVLWGATHFGVEPNEQW